MAVLAVVAPNSPKFTQTENMSPLILKKSIFIWIKIAPTDKAKAAKIWDFYICKVAKTKISSTQKSTLENRAILKTQKVAKATNLLTNTDFSFKNSSINLVYTKLFYSLRANFFKLLYWKFS